MTMTKPTILAVLIAAAAGTQLYAQGGPGDGARGERPSFAELDANGDGVLTREDLTARRDARFAELDSDGDGQVSAGEFAAHAAARAEEHAIEMFARLDADGDGILSRDTLEAAHGRRGDGAARMLERFDDDADGAISPEEFAAAEAWMDTHRGPGRHGSGHDRWQEHRRGYGGPRD